MTENIIVYTLIAILVGWAMSYLKKQNSKEVEPLENGTYRLRMNKLYLYVGVGSMILGLFLFLYLSLFVKDGVGIAFCLFLGFGILGFGCALWYWNHQVVFDSQFIESTSVFSKTTKMNWDEIHKISFGLSSGIITMKDKNNVKVKAHIHLKGIKELISMIEQKTEWTAKTLKLPI
jgi:hypothetical protein